MKLKRLDLQKVEHSVKVGDDCPYIKPNVIENCIFYDEGKPIGFFIRKVTGRLLKYLEIANKELRSRNVPKATMSRRRFAGNSKKGQPIYTSVDQYSAMIGSIPPKPNMGFNFATIAKIHRHKKAATFIKAMRLAARDAEGLIEQFMPEQYELQKRLIEENVSEEFRFGKLFTSSISNVNIAVDYHQDRANLKGCVNVIFTKRLNARGGNLNVPDYGATMDSCNNSLLVYPAWRNIHGVTPIKPTAEGGYRNSLIFYALRAFKKLM